MNNLIVLDCGSFDSALQSLGSIFHCSPVLLRDFLSNTDIDRYFEQHSELPLSFKEYLYEVVLKNIGLPKILDLIYWFHMTRISENTTFTEGILPLGDILPKLKTMLVDVIDDNLAQEQLRTALKHQGIEDFHFGNKINNAMHWGPYAILVRDVAFQANKLGQHDYLGMPEIIEDICNGLRKTCDYDLLEQFRAKLKPAIVKFSSSKVEDQACIATALCYVRSCILQQELDCNSVYCFNGENEPVPHSDIVCIEFIN